MKRFVFVMVLFAFSCTNHYSQNDKVKMKMELQTETQSLKALQDSFNWTGDYSYMQKYISKINYLIKKYPDQKGFKLTRKTMIDMYGDSLHLERENLK